MARDSEAGARDKRISGNVRGGSSGSNASLDPDRSSMRRMAPRRGNTRVSRAPQSARAQTTMQEPTIVERVSMPRVSLLPQAGDASGPRNRRVPQRAAAKPRGPHLGVRLWALLLAAASKPYRGGARVSALLSAKLEAPNPNELETSEATPPRKPTSPVLVRCIQLLGVLAIIGAGYGLSRFVQHHLTSAPAFAIDAIEVKGLSRLSREDLLSAAGVNLGMNVFARSPEDIHARLLRHPWILSAEVRRELPSRLRVIVRERDPIALLVVEACAPQPGRGEDDPACEEPSSLYLVSADAKMIKRVSGKEPIDLPVITGVTRQRLAGDADLSRRVVTQAVALMQEYRASDLWKRNPIGEIHLESNEGFSLYVGEDLTYVRLGAPPFAQKLGRMKKVFERLEQEHARAEYVYLDNEQRPDRVAVRLR